MTEVITIDDIVKIVDKSREWRLSEKIVTYKGDDGTQITIYRTKNRKRVEIAPGNSVYTFFVKATLDELNSIHCRLLEKEKTE